MAATSLMLAIAIATIADPSSAPGLRLQLVFEKNSFKQHDAIDVVAVLTNVGRLPVEVPQLMLPPAYWLRFEIKSPDGTIAKVTTHTTSTLSDRRIVLEPGQGFATSLGLANYYSMQKKGVYVVRAIYGRPPLDGAPSFAPIESKPITIRIL